MARLHDGVKCWRAIAIFAMLLAASASVISAQQIGQGVPATIIGSVYDTISRTPLPLATVRVSGTSTSVLTDDAGRFRVEVLPGDVGLEVRQIGFLPTKVRVVALAGVTRQDIYLHRLAVQLAPIVAVGKDDEAERLVRRAIARKHELYATIHDYRYSAYVKFAIRDIAKPIDSASSLLLIAETRSEIYWEEPNYFQETMLSRRQTSNLSAERNLVTVGEIANFQRELIQFQRYAVLSPIADDALTHYQYRVLDTLEVTGHRVFRLAITPESRALPLFAGTIDIADSSYDLVGVDVGFNHAVHFTSLRNLRYRQRFREMAPGRWMPYEVGLTGDLHLALPIPRIPRDLAFQHTAELSDFRFDLGHPPADLREVRVVIAPAVDRPDSAGWAEASRAIPLTPAESAAWQRIDSLQQIPPDFTTRMRLGAVEVIRVLSNPGFLHFNRVEGAYGGLIYAWQGRPDLAMHGSVGYASGSEQVEYTLAGKVRVSERQRTWLGAEIHEAVVTRPTFVSQSYNSTVRALLFRVDPLDYYRENGVTLSVATKVRNFTQLDLRYDDYAQSSLPASSNYSVFQAHDSLRPNPPIVDGQLRTLSATLSYDSRPLQRRGVRDEVLPRPIWTQVSFTLESAAPSLIPDDFHYQRFSVMFLRSQRTLNLGMTTISALAGVAIGDLPPQRYFTIDFGMKALTYQSRGFNTLGGNNFAGNRAAMITISHDFDRWLFVSSHLPVIEHLPFTLSVHAGAFWTAFVHITPQPADTLLRTAPNGYQEVGFGLGNLTPFLAPFNLAAHFSWSLSPSLTSKRQFHFGLSLGER